MNRAMETNSSNSRQAVLYGIGVGPGDPELVTVKGLNLLRRVPVVYVPKSSEESGSFALSVVENYLDASRQEILDLVFPMCKDRQGLGRFWDQSCRLILDRLQKGLDVACICIGDPLFYSTFANLMSRMLRMDPGVRVSIIPGVSSIAACTAVLKLPLVQAGERLAVLPATYDPEGIRQTLKNFETVVLMKVNRVVDRILPILEEMGLKKQAIFVNQATTDQQEIIADLDRLRGKTLNYHSMIIVRKDSGE